MFYFALVLQGLYHYTEPISRFLLFSGDVFGHGARNRKRAARERGVVQGFFDGHPFVRRGARSWSQRTQPLLPASFTHTRSQWGLFIDEGQGAQEGFQFREGSELGLWMAPLLGSTGGE